ncbi:peptidylprolyl isomerase [Agrococcus jejuensis]|uniref:Peptidyl-prolyl cis-trans isomerase n=1 Tax=Agrococcus jejuensis TaxID=399736 RepID=A0A1G8ARC8_9MICO|nr:peptidylprolyl isomerase [Agrococcus jejuensis]SDH23622.1 peptidyl-prolyl cis-trans isomerase B (cyclophilin B) [Agrococcus jejuensis]
MRSRLIPAALLLSATLALVACSTPDSPASPSTSAGTATDGCAYVSDGSGAVEAPPAEPAVSGEVAVTLETSAGAIGMTLDADRTPCTVGSFTSLADQGYLDGTQCHRLTTEGIFVLQCGDPTGTGRGGPGYSYADELDGTETYSAGTVAMANAGPDTNGSQFFLVYEDSPLPPSYTVFGTMDEAGLAVVAAIGAAGVAGGGPDGAPADDVTIASVAIG